MSYLYGGWINKKYWQFFAKKAVFFFLKAGTFWLKANVFSTCFLVSKQTYSLHAFSKFGVPEEFEDHPNRHL